MCSKSCIDIFGKIFQVLVLITLIVTIICFITNVPIKTTLLVIFIIIYVLYLILEFKSPLCSFLCHKTNENGIKNHLGNLIQTPPEIQFYCECYHYETRVVRYNPPKRGGKKRSVGRKSGGRSRGTSKRRRTRTRTQRRRVTTWTETVTFPYYSARDVSGLFELKNSREEAMGKTYVKLELNPEINFADNLSYMDYENFRTDFYNRNRPRDQYMTYRETRRVPGLNSYNFVLIRNEEPCGVNICLFILLTIIPLVELYKCYVNSYCLDQKFTIRKLISTRYDLNQNQQYQSFTPSINIPSQQYVFEPNNYNYINNQYSVHAPTQEEINRAAQYNNKIPNYQCVSYTSLNDGQIKVGVVQDDPAYCSVNVNEAAPPNCQDVGPQMNPNTNMNMNMNMNANMINSNNINDQGIDSNNNLNNNMNMNNYNNNMNMNNYNNNMNNYNNNMNMNNYNNNMNMNNNNNNMNNYNNNMNMNNYNNNMVNNEDDDDEDDDEEGNVGYSGS